MEQPVKFNSIKKFKVIASTANTFPIFHIKKKNKEKDRKIGLRNLVLMPQVE